jgi:hypothetical protein
MSTTIKDFRELYNNIPKSEPAKQPIAPNNPELIGKTIDHLTKQPIIAPNITRK